MKTQIILSLLFTVLLFGCKKDKDPGIDYNVLTEQRILEISEQATIKDEDIATLERLLANVTDNNLKPIYIEMIAGVKIFKDFIPAFNQLRIDPDVNFQEQYTKLSEQIKRVTDKLPRKAKLQTELETTLANYNTEEVEFLPVVLEDGNLASFLADNNNIRPVEGKPNRYLRSDIEKVDSLVMHFGSSWAKEQGILKQVLRRFRGLKYLFTSASIETEWDFNYLSNLETLNLDLSTTAANWELKIDALKNLKHLKLSNALNRGTSPFGEVIDFTDKLPLLESLELPNMVTNKLTTFLLPNKQHLNKLVLPMVNSAGGAFHKIKRLVVEGNGITYGNFTFGTPSAHFEVDEVRLSGFTASNNTQENSILALSAGGNTVTIKKATLKDIDLPKMAFSNVDIGELALENVPFSKDATSKGDYDISVRFLGVGFPQKPSLSWVNLLKVNELAFSSTDFSNLGKLGIWAYADVSRILSSAAHFESLRTLTLDSVWPYPGKTIDLSKFKNLQQLTCELRDLSDNSTVVLDKVIVNTAVKSTFKLIDAMYSTEAESVKIEYKN
ncbi:MAG: hypothetical protein LBF27_29165 [Sphingobacterium sp.]|jgi:hypothetical protein|nr:hypothetical protein [Sphingobacterium sp.]